MKIGDTATLKPGDDVTMRVDVGDQYPIWENRRVLWSQTPDGTPVFGSQPLTAGATMDFNYTESGTEFVPGKN